MRYLRVPSPQNKVSRSATGWHRRASGFGIIAALSATAVRETTLSALAQALQSEQFVVTSELNPPKGVDLQALFAKAAVLRDCVQAVNVTDSAGAHMTLAPLAACHLLLDHGIEPILQLTSRDRNRIALQGDILGAAAMICDAYRSNTGLASG